jgi:hypothetical protein
MPRGVETPPDIKARARSLLLAGHRQSEVCELTGLGKATVCEIAATMFEQLESVRTKKLDSDLDLIMAYFRAALNAMISQAALFSDHDYCRTQNAHDLAIAHGVLGDKLAGVAATAQALGLVGPAAPAFPDPQLPEPANHADIVIDGDARSTDP